MKRRIYRLKWSKGCWTLTENGEVIYVYDGSSKAQGEESARAFCRMTWEVDRIPCQLLIYTKAGRIGKGGRYEASYGCNSKRRKG